MTSLYQDLGGADAVNATVDLFYRKVLADARINRFFDGIEMPAQIVKQKAFLTVAFGGPNKYTGRAMRSAHRGAVLAGINDTHFDVVVELLGESLTELGVSPELIAQDAEIAESVRDDVLNRQRAPSQ